MKKAQDIYKVLEELLSYYESYLIRNEDANLTVMIDYESISFYLEGKDVNDELVLHFDPKERDILNYLAVKVIVRLFGHVQMHLEGVTLYNEVHKKNMKIHILNGYVRTIAELFVKYQDREFINDELDIVKTLAKQANKGYPKSFIKELKERTDVSKKLLR